MEKRPRECKKRNFEEKEMARRHGEEDEQGGAKDLLFILFFLDTSGALEEGKISDVSNSRKISDKLYLPYFDTPFF